MFSVRLGAAKRSSRRSDSALAASPPKVAVSPPTAVYVLINPGCSRGPRASSATAAGTAVRLPPLCGERSSRRTRRGTVFDRPHVVEAARQTIRAKGYEGRCDAIGGDFLDAVPPGGDLYVLKFILIDWKDAEALRILQNCRTAVTPAGAVLVIEITIPDDNRASPGQLMDLNMFVMTGGPERTQSQYGALLAQAAPLLPEARRGLLLFLRRGMWAWTQAVATAAAVPPPPTHVTASVFSSPQEFRGVIHVFAAMALSSPHRSAR